MSVTLCDPLMKCNPCVRGLPGAVLMRDDSFCHDWMEKLGQWDSWYCGAASSEEEDEDVLSFGDEDEEDCINWGSVVVTHSQEEVKVPVSSCVEVVSRWSNQQQQYCNRGVQGEERSERGVEDKDGGDEEEDDEEEEDCCLWDVVKQPQHKGLCPGEDDVDDIDDADPLLQKHLAIMNLLRTHNHHSAIAGQRPVAVSCVVTHLPHQVRPQPWQQCKQSAGHHRMSRSCKMEEFRLRLPRLSLPAGHRNGDAITLKRALDDGTSSSEVPDPSPGAPSGSTHHLEQPRARRLTFATLFVHNQQHEQHQQEVEARQQQQILDWAASCVPAALPSSSPQSSCLDNVQT